MKSTQKKIVGTYSSGVKMRALKMTLKVRKPPVETNKHKFRKVCQIYQMMKFINSGVQNLWLAVWMPSGGAYAQKFNNSEKKLITLNWTIEQAAF